MRHQLPLALLLASSTFACVDNSPSGTDLDTDTAVVESQLEQENGGFDDADEPEMFGQQPAFDAIALEGDAAVTDTMASDPSVTAIENRLDGERHRILAVWGRMPADPDATDGRDWSGSLRISRGALVVRRTVGFETDTDRVLARETPDRVAFRSVTRPFADGLVLRVLDPDPNAGAPRLRYESADGLRTHELDLADLRNGPRVIDAGDGNRIVAVALRERDTCDHGFMRGRWIGLRDNLSAFRGLIVNADGEVTGHIRGIAGQRRNGDKVMFAKFIGRDGAFRGILSGTYEAGSWHARWLTRAGDHGVAGGVYFDAPNLRGGGFMGRWAETSCAQ